VKVETFEPYVDFRSGLCGSAGAPTTSQLCSAIILKSWAAAASAGRPRNVVFLVRSEAFLMDFLVDFWPRGSVDLAAPPTRPAPRRRRPGP